MVNETNYQDGEHIETIDPALQEKEGNKGGIYAWASSLAR